MSTWLVAVNSGDSSVLLFRECQIWIFLPQERGLQAGETDHYGDSLPVMHWMLMFPQTAYVESSNPNVVVFGGRFFGRCLGHEGRPLTKGIGAHIRWGKRGSFSSPSTSQEEALTKTQPCGHLDLGLPVPRTVRLKFLLFKSSSLCYLL